MVEACLFIRPATLADIQAIVDIYNEAVLHTTAIWNESTVDVENRIDWFKARQQAGYPVLVAENENAQVMGYASFADWRFFEGYRYTVEHSVYVRTGYQGAGVGRSLMLALIEQARILNKHIMLAAIEGGNTASIALHQKLGFEQVGLMQEVGTKFGRWLDLVFLQLKLDARLRPDALESSA